MDLIKYNTFLFDWDGTLSNTLENAKNIYVKLASKKGIKINLEDIQKVVGNWETSAKLAGYSSEEEFRRKYNREVLNSLGKVKLNKGAKRLLEKIDEKGFQTAIVTSSKRNWIIEQAKRELIDHLITEVIGIDEVENAKPHPEPILKALATLGAKLEESVFIGDTIHDLEAGKAAQIDTIYYTNKLNRAFYGEVDLIKSDLLGRIEDFSEMSELL